MVIPSGDTTTRAHSRRSKLQKLARTIEIRSLRHRTSRPSDPSGNTPSLNPKSSRPHRLIIATIHQERIDELILSRRTVGLVTSFVLEFAEEQGTATARNSSP